MKQIMFLPVLAVVLDLLSAVLGQQASVPPPSTVQCRSFNSRFCPSGPIGWSKASLPNLAGSATPSQVEEDLALYYPLYTTACSNALVHLICSVYYPFCFHNEEDYQTLYPCRELCEYVRCSCEGVVRELGADWPKEFECSNFPSAQEGTLCYPNNDNVTFYRTSLKFPEIGANHDEVTRCGELTTASPTSGGTHSNQNVSLPQLKCPVARLRVTNATTGYQRYKLAGYQECGLPCDPTVLTEVDQSKLFHIILLIASFVAFISLAVTILTVGIDRQRFPYPQRPFVFIGMNYLVVALTGLVGNIHGLSNGLPGCDEGIPQFTMQGQPISFGDSYTGKIGSCSAEAFFLYYTNMAALTWWVILSFMWFLATALKWAEEAIGKFWLLYHVLAWGIPLIQVIFVLAFQAIDAELPSRVCYVGNSDLVVLGVAVLLPTVVYTTVGGVFFTISIIALCSIYKSLRDQKDKSRKIRVLLVRVTVLGFLILVPNATLVLLYVYEISQRPLWERHALCQQATPTELANIPECSYPRDPAPYGYYIIKHLVWLIPSMAIFSWILSVKTLDKWRDFGNTLLMVVTKRQRTKVPTKSSDSA